MILFREILNYSELSQNKEGGLEFYAGKSSKG
jgi:hypothetical protein